MYTRCPACETLFSLTPTQLQAREGLVRCGRCTKVFHAEDFLVDAPQASEKAQAADTGKSTKSSGKRGGKTKKSDRKTTSNAKVKHKTEKQEKPKHLPAEITPAAEDSSPAPLQIDFPLQDFKPLYTRTPFWVAGGVSLLLVFAAQLTLFYGDELAHTYPRLRPVLAHTCALIACKLSARQDLRRIDLLEPEVAPHPKFDKALRINATLVNRASFAQAYPLLEISLTDNQGRVVARRLFMPNEYLEKPPVEQERMLPHLAIPVLLDITHPDKRASGFEIRLISPS